MAIGRCAPGAGERDWHGCVSVPGHCKASWVVIISGSRLEDVLSKPAFAVSGWSGHMTASFVLTNDVGRLGNRAASSCCCYASQLLSSGWCVSRSPPGYPGRYVLSKWRTWRSVKDRAASEASAARNIMYSMPSTQAKGASQPKTYAG